MIKLAWARSGDKGDKANIGVIARKAEYLPYIWAALTEGSVAQRFSHFIEGGADAEKVQRFYMPGSNAINFLIDPFSAAAVSPLFAMTRKAKAMARSCLRTLSQSHKT